MMTTDDQIEIDVRDDSTALARIFTLPVPARLEALAEMNGVSSFWYAGITGDALDAAYDKVTAAFDTGNGFSDWTPYVLGDLVAERVGARPVGVPHMGGYAVGRRIVERYLEASQLKAAQAIVRPASEILAGAGVRTR